MHTGAGFLRDLALVLCTAAVTTVLFQRLRLPVVLGYVLAGMIVGPHIPVPMIADRETVDTLAELGVVLLMFSLGLEFSLRKLLQVGAQASLVAVVQVSVMAWLGYLAARWFGWSRTEALFTGAALSISSTTIIAKAFDEQRVSASLRELVFAVLIVEDLIAILLLAGLTTVGSGASFKALAVTGGQLAAFLVGLVVIGLLLVPRTLRMVVRLGRPETTLVASIGLCFACALLAHEFGYSVALGAFIAGSLCAESGEVTTIEHLVQPVRDMFAAIFFVAVGMMIDPRLIAEHWLAVVVLTAVVVVGKLAGVSLGAFFAGRSIRTSVEAGMSMAQIGEFSFLIATLGVSMGATREFLYPVTVAVSAITTLLTPWLIRGSEPAGTWIDHRVPRSVRTFESLYATWIEGLRVKRAGRRPWTGNKARIAWLAIDTLAIVGIVIGIALMLPQLAEFFGGALHASHWIARAIVITGAAVACAPFAAGIALQARRLAQAWATDVFAAAQPGALDLAAAPRHALVIALQLAIMLACGLPALAVIQPFVASMGGVIAVLAVAALLAWIFGRSVVDLEGHVRAGAQVVAETISRQSRAQAQPDLGEVSALLPGLGRLTPVRIEERAGAIGRSLAELDIHARTSATVVCIARGHAVVAPNDGERVQVGDWVALTGTDEAVERARALLQPRRDEP